MKRPETIREFIDRRSNAAWVSFEFTIDGTRYYVCSTDEFILDYGRKNAYLLDKYYVVNTKESYPSNSQGQIIWLTELKSKEDFNKEASPIVLSYTRFLDILDHLYKARDLADEKALDYAINRLEADFE